MPRPSLLSAAALLSLAAALSGCEPQKPAESPEATSEPGAGKEKPEADMPKEAKDEPAPARAGGGGDKEKPAGPAVDKSMSLDTYEMTPSDCNALGRHYGEVSRNDQMAALSPKLSEKQRSSTAAQIDKVVGKLEETWTNGCHTSLVNKAVDHDGIKCALAAKTVKEFDVCINGAGGAAAPPAGKPAGKKK